MLRIFAPPVFHPVLAARLPTRSERSFDTLDAFPTWRERGSPEGLFAILLFGPSASELLDLAAGPCWRGVPVGLVPAEDPQALKPWLQAVTAEPGEDYQILAMWKQLYLAWGGTFSAAVRTGRPESTVRFTPADQVERADACALLQKGPRLAIYAGHGRARGWSGYRGVRWADVASAPHERPVGTLLTLTCSNLELSDREDQPFGLRWVSSGRACAFFGAVGGVQVEPLESIAGVLCDLLADGEVATVGELLAGCDARIRAAGEVGPIDSWESFRLVGDPFQRI